MSAISELHECTGIADAGPATMLYTEQISDRPAAEDHARRQSLAPGEASAHLRLTTESAPQVSFNLPETITGNLTQRASSACDTNKLQLSGPFFVSFRLPTKPHMCMLYGVYGYFR